MYTYKDKIKRLRKIKGLSQTEFAKQTGVSRSYIAQIELGHKTPSLQYLDNIVKTFNLNKTYWFEDDNKELYMEFLDNNISLLPQYNRVVNNNDTKEILHHIDNVVREIRIYYQRLIDIKLMNNKLNNFAIEDKLTEFIEDFAYTMNKYNNDIFVSKGSSPLYSDIPFTDIKNLNEDERNEYLQKLYSDRQKFEFVFFHYFKVFYDKYMEDWYKSFSK